MLSKEAKRTPPITAPISMLTKWWEASLRAAAPSACNTCMAVGATNSTANAAINAPPPNAVSAPVVLLLGCQFKPKSEPRGKEAADSPPRVIAHSRY